MCPSRGNSRSELLTERFKPLEPGVKRVARFLLTPRVDGGKKSYRLFRCPSKLSARLPALGQSSAPPPKSYSMLSLAHLGFLAPLAPLESSPSSSSLSRNASVRDAIRFKRLSRSRASTIDLSITLPDMADAARRKVPLENAAGFW